MASFSDIELITETSVVSPTRKRPLPDVGEVSGTKKLPSSLMRALWLIPFGLSIRSNTILFLGSCNSSSNSNESPASVASESVPSKRISPL